MIAPPATETELLARAHALAGLRLGELAEQLNFSAPGTARRTKGWSGELLERALGADAGNRPAPDFTRLGVELKTIPVDARGKVRESTYVCRAPAQVPPAARWHESLVWHKLRRVLWLPIEAAGPTELPRRRIGWAFLWSPSPAEEALLRADWEELTELLALGRRDEITAHLGQVLQLRPKAADAQAHSLAADADGVPAPIAPRGFYLRARFTQGLLTARAPAA